MTDSPLHSLDDAISVLRTIDTVRAPAQRPRDRPPPPRSTMASSVPDLEQFGHDDAWRMGSALVARCRAEQLPVTISIWLGEQRVFHAALPGTSADNDAWVEKKARVVRRFGRSSLEVYEHYVANDARTSSTIVRPVPRRVRPWRGGGPDSGTRSAGRRAGGLRPGTGR